MTTVLKIFNITMNIYTTPSQTVQVYNSVTRKHHYTLSDSVPNFTVNAYHKFKIEDNILNSLIL